MTIDEYFKNRNITATDLVTRLRAAADDEWRVPVSVSVALMLAAADALETLVPA